MSAALKSREDLMAERRRTYGAARVCRGYVQVAVPGHPRALHPTSYVAEHVLIAERALGRYLPKPAEVHHVDGDKSNNANSNLVICQDRAYHKLIHRRADALRLCGNADWRRCGYCKNYDDLSSLTVVPNRASSGDKIYHKGCAADYQRRLSQKRRAV